MFNNNFVSKLLLLSLLTLATCKSDKEVTPDLTGVNEPFREYVLRFISEAKARNVQVDVSSLKIESVAARINGFCGYTSSVLPNPPFVQIAEVSSCWTDQTDMNKEILIFHELGHGLLKRNHDDALLTNGLWKTIMHSGNQFDRYNEFTGGLRKYYLDELFHPGASVASVVLSHSNTKVIMEDSIAAVNDWQFTASSSGSTHIGTLSNTDFASPHHALSITSVTAAASSQFSYFRKTIPVAGIPATSDVLVNFKIKLKAVTKGAAVGVNVFSQGKFAAFATTQDIINLTGTQDFKQYILQVPYFPDKAETMTIYLILFGETTGTAVFDDIEVINSY